MKVAVITGGTKGIGRAIGLRLAAKGWDLAVTWRKDAENARTFAGEVEKLGRRLVSVQADHTQDRSIDLLFDTVAKELKVADLFVANAAATVFVPLMQLKAHQIDKTMAMVVKSYILGCQRAVPLMEGRKGNVIAISGMDANNTVPLHGLLGAGKAAMELLTRYLAVELAGHGIRVNAVNPGLVDTDSSRFYAGAGFDQIAKAASATIPAGRIAYPEDVAKLVEFLVSPEAEYITGQTVILDGGLSVAPRMYGG